MRPTSLDVTQAIHPGEANTLAVKVTPERAIQDVNGVELADSWFDWINWKYLGYKGKTPKQSGDDLEPPSCRTGTPASGSLCICTVTGPLRLANALVNTELPLPRTDSATLTVYANLTNASSNTVHGVIAGDIDRPGKPTIHLEQPVSLNPGETREIVFTPGQFSQLQIQNPDLWWPYTIGKPNLYHLELHASVEGRAL